MFHRPFNSQGKRPARQAAACHFKRPGVDQGLVFGVKRMETLRSVIAPEHLDDDTEELADRGHGLDYAPELCKVQAANRLRSDNNG